MNQEQNNFNPNNFNNQNFNNGMMSNQPLPNNQNLNNQFNPNVNVNQPTFNQQSINPQPQSTVSYQQPINQVNMQQPAPQPVNTFESGNANNQNFNSKPPKKLNIGLIVGISAAVVVATIIGIVLLSNNKGDNNNSNSNSIFSPSNKYVDGKIPYNKEVNKCAKEIVSYKDNTRELCYQEPIYYNAENYYDRDYARFINFSLYLNTDEKNVLSFKLELYLFITSLCFI